MSLFRSFGAIVLLTFLALPAATAADAVADDAKRMEGTWQLEVMEFQGMKAPPENLKGKKVTIVAGTLTMPDGRKSTLKLDPDKTPKRVDVHTEGTLSYGIYSIEDGKLQICFDTSGEDRPTEFKSPEGKAIFLMVLKKEK